METDADDAADNLHKYAVKMAKLGGYKSATMVEDAAQHIDGMIEAIAGLDERIEALESENAALREDKARLDWIEVEGADVCPMPDEGDAGSLIWDVETLNEPSRKSVIGLRAAIDAAREGE